MAGLTQWVQGGFSVSGNNNVGYALPQQEPAGNTILIGVQSSTANAGFTIDDGSSGSNTWTEVYNVTLGGQRFGLYRCKLSVAVDYVNAVFDDAGTAYGSMWVACFWGLANTQNGANNNTGSGTGFNAGAITLSTPSLVFAFASNTSTENAEVDSLAVGASGGELIGANIQEGLVMSFVVTSSNVTPAFVTTGALNWACLAVALAVDDGEGTAPDAGASRIIGVQHNQFRSTGAGANPYAMQFPTRGNCFALTSISAIGTGNPTIASISDGQSNTWAFGSENADGTHAPFAGVANAWYADLGASPDVDMTLSITWDNAPDTSFGTCVVLYDMQNYSFDTASNGTGSQGSSGNLTVGGLTAAGAGILINVLGINQNLRFAIERRSGRLGRHERLRQWLCAPDLWFGRQQGHHLHVSEQHRRRRRLHLGVDRLHRTSACGHLAAPLPVDG